MQESIENVKTLGVTAAAWSGGGRVGAEVDRHGGESRVSLRRGESIRVAELMAPPPPSVPSHLAIGAARKVGALRATDILLVEIDGLLVGLLDLSRIGPGSDADPVSAHMASLTFAASPGASARRTRDWLVDRGASCAPVIVGLFLVGTITRAQLDEALRASAAAPRTRAAA